MAGVFTLSTISAVFVPGYHGDEGEEAQPLRGCHYKENNAGGPDVDQGTATSYILRANDKRFT